MITVIADDFTGAAELAGISLNFGLKVELFTNIVNHSNADVVIVSTDSRSLIKAEALKKTEEVIKEVLKLQPTVMYKKIDSVLRGYVVDEIKIQMNITGKKKALIIPANPTLGRIIINKEYFINDKKITETNFVNDPEFPVTSSFVKQMLNNEVEIVEVEDELKPDTINVAATKTVNDIINWSSKNLNEIVVAGAGDFYTALLQKQFEKVACVEEALETPILFVSGTSFEASKNILSALKQNADTIEDIDNYFYLIKISKEKFVLEIKNNLFDITALQLREAMAIVTSKLISEYKIKELFIEGGSTAASVLKELKINKLIPVNEIERGVVRMKADKLFITVKPGSYKLAKNISNFLEM